MRPQPTNGQACLALKSQNSHTESNPQEETTMALRADSLKPELNLLVSLDTPTANLSDEDWAEKALVSKLPIERLEFMRQMVARHPQEQGQKARYIELLEGLVREWEGDYSSPVTSYGVLAHFRQLPEDIFLERLAAVFQKTRIKLNEDKAREAHRDMVNLDLPVLPQQEREALYLLGESNTPTQNRIFLELLKDTTGQLIYDYCDTLDLFEVFETKDWLAETVIQALKRLRPDFREMLISTLNGMK